MISLIHVFLSISRKPRFRRSRVCGTGERTDAVDFAVNLCDFTVHGIAVRQGTHVVVVDFEPAVHIGAVEQLDTVKPDLMLLDIEMPRMDGFEVTNLVRHHEIHRDLPIIMITSRTGEKHRERALSLGVNQYMGKPFQEETLLENIESLLTVR